MDIQRLSIQVRPHQPAAASVWLTSFVSLQLAIHSSIWINMVLALIDAAQPYCERYLNEVDGAPVLTAWLALRALRSFISFTIASVFSEAGASLNHVSRLYTYLYKAVYILYKAVYKAVYIYL
jgi:hypothetical protein